MASDLPRQVRERVEAAIVREEYALAATIVSEVLDETFLQTAIAGRFPDEQLERIDLAETAVELVAHLTTGLVITTNFDGVLEHVFACSGSPFVDRVYGANPTQVIPAIQENRLVLWKIHGDRHDPRTRVLSSEEGAHR
jgi:hypothetical protein